MANPTDYIEINDFSPGIYGDFNASGNSPTSTTNVTTLRGAVPAGNGAAVVENTYDCTADQTGALIPLPKATVGRTQTLLPGGNANNGTTRMPAGMNFSYLLDAHVIPRSYDGMGDATGGDRIYTLWNFRYDPAGTSSYSNFLMGREYRNYGATSLYDFLWQKVTSTWSGQLASGSMDTARLYGLSS